MCPFLGGFTMPRKTFTFEGKRYDIVAPTPEELAVKIAMKKRDLEEGKVTISGNTKVKDWIDKYLETYKRNTLANVSYTDLKSRINKNITSQIGNMFLKDVRPLHCQKILNNLSGFSANHIKKVHNAMADIFEKAVDNKLILNNPATKLEKPKGYTQQRRAITKYERIIILQVADSHRHGLWILLMLYCGLRPNETSLVQGRHIDFKKGILHIEGTKTANANRYVPIPEILLDKLPKLEPYQFLFLSESGTKINDDCRGRMWHSFKREMNVAMGCEVYRNQIVPPFRVSVDLVPYCLRHTYCTDLQAAGVPINVAKELMGHSDISLTARIYTHKSEESFNAAATLINAFQSGKNDVTDDNSHTNSHTLSV